MAVTALKKGKSSGVDNTPTEFVQASRETDILVLTQTCNKI